MGTAGQGAPHGPDSGQATGFPQRLPTLGLSRLRASFCLPCVSRHLPCGRISMHLLTSAGRGSRCRVWETARLQAQGQGLVLSGKLPSGVEWGDLEQSQQGWGLHSPISPTREQSLEPWSPGDGAVGEEEKGWSFLGLRQHISAPAALGIQRRKRIYHFSLCDPLSKCHGVLTACPEPWPALGAAHVRCGLSQG